MNLRLPFPPLRLLVETSSDGSIDAIYIYDGFGARILSEVKRNTHLWTHLRDWILNQPQETSTTTNDLP